MATVAPPPSESDKQDNRDMEIRFFGGGPSHGLVLEGFDCTERISDVFEMEVNLSTSLSEDEAYVFIQPEMILGTKAVVSVDLPEGEQRHFCGVITSLDQTGADPDRIYYRATLVPWMWLFSQMTDCRVFQKQTVVEIIDTLVKELSKKFTGLVSHPSDLSVRLKTVMTAYGEPQGDHSKRDICVQYNETTLDFIMRLLEEEGISFHFEHTDDSCTLVLTDDPSMRKTCEHQKSARHVASSGRRDAEPGLFAWSKSQAISPGVASMRDHHFEEFSNPVVKRDASKPAKEKQAFGGNDKLEIYEYGGGFCEPYNDPRARGEEVLPEGDRRAQWMLDAAASHQRGFAGESSCAAFTVGTTFDRNLAPPPKEGEEEKEDFDRDGPFLITEVRHYGSQASAYTTAGGSESVYHNRFWCVPAEVAYRPARQTPRPMIAGVQTAVVEGPDGKEPTDEEIHVDEFGRIKVRFHWDRIGRQDDGRTSAWIRVGQGWASGGFGMHFWPRVGDEVIVAFENGDPDRPLCVGSVYNSQKMPPYALPEHKTRSGIKTKSYPGGDVLKHFNEIRFEDKKGKEQIYVHAENSLKTVVEGCESRSVGGSRNTYIHKNDDLTVEKGDRTATINEGHDKLTVQEGNREVGIAQGDDIVWVVNGNSDTDVPEGRYRVSSKTMLLEAADDITLRCGPSEIRLTPKGIFLTHLGERIELTPGLIDINAPFVKINS